MRFFLCSFFLLLPKFTDLMNFDNCIGKITSKSIRLYPVFFKDLNLIIKELFLVKMRSSGNYNFDHAHSFFGKDF